MSQIVTIFPGLAEKQYFQHPETQEFWFHATAACKSLGFDNPSRALMMYTDEDERFKEVHEGRETWFVSESGFYGLAFASKKPEAKTFKRWLKHDVLPKLRSQGIYITQNDGESLAEYQEREKALLAQNEKLVNRCNRIIKACNEVYYDEELPPDLQQVVTYLKGCLEGFKQSFHYDSGDIISDVKAKRIKSESDIKFHSLKGSVSQLEEALSHLEQLDYSAYETFKLLGYRLRHFGHNGANSSFMMSPGYLEKEADKLDGSH